MMDNVNVDEQIKTLRFQRGQLKGKITRFQGHLDNIMSNAENIDFEDLQARFSRLSNILDQFEEIQGKIEILSETLDDEERVSFENAYFQLNKRVQGLERDNINYVNTREGSIASYSNQNVECAIKLPTLNLPTFTGQFDEWRGFEDLFKDMIDGNENLSKVQKFYYLKSCLKGEAAEVIRGITVNNENYETAWTMLKEQYENEKRIISKHMKAIYDMPQIKTESAQSLKSLIHNFNKNFRALTALGQPTIHWDTPMIISIRSKIDTTSKKEWDKLTKKDDIKDLTINKFITFLSERAELLESEGDDSKRINTFSKTKVVNLFSRNVKCNFCKGNHFNNDCTEFVGKTNKQKFEEVKKNKLCLNCLRPGHFVNDCRSQKCKYCGKKHHSLLHNSELVETTDEKSAKDKVELAAQQSVLHASTNLNTSNGPRRTQVLLATAIVYLRDADGNKVESRALLDTGAQSNFMSKGLARKLKLNCRDANIPVAGVNNLSSSITKTTNTCLMSLDERYSTFTNFLIINKITDDLPQIPFDITEFNIPSHIKFADPKMNESRSIDLLLGVQIFFDIMKQEQLKLNIQGGLILQNTKLGWIMAGKVPILKQTNSVKCCLVTGRDELHEYVKNFWKSEEIEHDRVYSVEEMECEEHFKNTYKRDKDGRFELCLPLKENYESLGNSERNAIKQFYNLEKRFDKNHKLKQEYIAFMKEYESLGHMELVSDTDDSKLNYYLPHHGVIKESSTTTKLRVVFNASATTDSGLSLNNVLKTGPVIQNDLFTIIMNFGVHNVVFTADVTKMYRQCNIVSEQRNLQRIVWRDDRTETLKHYQLNTITYGTTSASFMACRCLLQLAIDNEKDFPDASYSIKNEFYMDDLVSGSENIENALLLKTRITDILKTAGFELRKWSSNHAELFDNTDTNNTPEYFINKDETIRTLGLIWNPRSDTFSYLVNVPHCNTPTKRFALSVVSRIFDPLGLINPVVVKGKLFLQMLWQRELGWDEPFTSNLSKLFYEFYDCLKQINDISIPRQVIAEHTCMNDIQIHGFSDASESAFGACLYLRYTCDSQHFSSKLLCAKSKLAPIKKITLPRLELNAALLLSRMIHKVIKSFRISPLKVFCWCNSTIVLHWLAAEPNAWNTYVANRVSEIQKLTQNYEWRHVTSKQNPADIVSRGCDPQTLHHSQLWWSGPEFLRLNSECWPRTQVTEIIDVPDLRKGNVLLVTAASNFIFNKFSSVTKLQRVLAYVLRFIDCMKGRRTFKSMDLSLLELNKSQTILIKLSQHEYFNGEIKSLKSNQPLPRSSKLLNLNVFLDNEGLLRVGGRIKHSLGNFDKKHPVLLHPKHILTTLLIQYEHKLLLHAGQQAVLASLRCQFWPLHGKSIVRKVLRKCMICFKCKPISQPQLMGDLPASRLVPCRPFYRVGIDYAGPILLKDGISRNRTLVKGYICIFICLTTKAIHIELAGDLSAKTFLNCFKRFVSRRGFSSQIFSDNGTNFTGANNDLKRTIRELLANEDLKFYLSQHQIKWSFNCPYTAYQGGLWEAAVKSAKYHLVRIIGNCHLTYEALSTILCQIESVLNSRPITPLSSDPEDLTPLTPSHFLIGDLLTAVPQFTITAADNRLKIYERLQKMFQHFWRRWSTEYLTSLQRRTKWLRSKSNLAVGDLVLIIEDDPYPLHWRTGRIIELHRGSDNFVRVVTLKTSNGVTKRGVNKLCKLPIE